MTDTSDLPRVVIVGFGFGGLAAVKRLVKAPVRVTVVDRNNYHSFLALVYQVASAELETTDIAYPVRSILRRKRSVEFIMAEVQGVDLDKKVLLTDWRSDLVRLPDPGSRQCAKHLWRGGRQGARLSADLCAARSQPAQPDPALLRGGDPGAGS